MVARVALAAFLLASRVFAQAMEDDSGTYVQLLLPAAALTAAIAQQDYEGATQFVYTFAASAATTEFLKQTAHKRRPDVTNFRSFPSGHASNAFAAAGFIDVRYGGPWGKVALGGALWVACTRVSEQRHFATDVLAGGSIAMLYNWAIVHPIGTSRVRFVPEVHGGYYGVTLSLVDREMKEPFEAGFRPRYRYDFAIGASHANRHTATLPPEIDLDPFTQDYDAAAQGFFTAFLGEDNRHEIALGLVPYEFAELGVLPETVDVGGQIFRTNTTTYNRYALIDFRIRYAHNFTPRGPVHLKAGLSASIRDLSFRLRQGDRRVLIDEVYVLPLVYLAAWWRISRRFSAGVETESIHLGDRRSIDVSAWIRYHLSQHWEIGVGYFWLDRDVETSGYHDRHTLHRVMLLFTYQW